MLVLFSPAQFLAESLILAPPDFRKCSGFSSNTREYFRASGSALLPPRTAVHTAAASSTAQAQFPPTCGTAFEMARR